MSSDGALRALQTLITCGSAFGEQIIWVLVIVGTIVGVVMAPWGIQTFFDLGHKKLQPRTVLVAIRVVITSYETEHQHFPISESARNSPDVTIRTRGPFLTALMGNEATPLNPKGIKFLDLPPTRGRKYGLWQDGTEWVLSDRWGEPLYIVFDTNKDGKIANPESGADTPAMLPLGFIIYSSGPDRDPKTW